MPPVPLTEWCRSETRRDWQSYRKIRTKRNDSGYIVHEAPETKGWWGELAKQYKPNASAQVERQAYLIPLLEAMKIALKDNNFISIKQEVMAGAPCIAGTRIPVYMVLDELEECGTVDGVIESYPRLSREQVLASVQFAKTVVECPLDDQE